MKVLFPFSWIKEFLKTDTDLKTIIRSVNATGPTIEKTIHRSDDQLLDIEVTINRPDCLGILGVAREIYVSLKQLRKPAELKNDFFTHWPKISPINKKIPLKFKIDSRLNPRFNAVLLTGIKIKPSPKIIQERLQKSGIRSLNNVIDLTNYLMLESGQPNHAFDFGKITGPEFMVRAAQKGEAVITLDNRKHALEKGDMVIQDSSGQIIDLAGIMGGRLSEIDEKTTEVLLIVANDYYGQIRKTAMRLGIQTEASARLTKVLSPEITYPTVLRGIELFQKYSGAKQASEIVDFYPKPIKKPFIVLTDDFLEEKIGLKIEPQTTDRILKDLGFKVQRNKNKIRAVPPIWRLLDVNLPIDLVEEVARIYNYDQIPTQPLTFEIPPKAKPFQKIFYFEDRLRQLLVDWGFTETLSYSMLNYKEIINLGWSKKGVIKIANPLSIDWEYMQPTLIPNFLKNMQTNLPQTENLRLFEIANVFDPKGREARSLIFGGNRLSFWDLKGFLQAIFFILNIPRTNLGWQKTDHPAFSETVGAKITVNQKTLAHLGQIKNTVADGFQLKKGPFLAEINLDLLISLISEKPKKYQPISKYPAITQDMAFIVGPQVKAGEMLALIKKTSSLIQGISLLDAFKNTRTFRITYQSQKKTLTDKEVEVIRKNIIREMRKRFKVQLKQ